MTSSNAVPLPELSTAELFERAAAEIADDDPEWHYTHLVALHQRPTREVFDIARALATDSDPARREVGVRVLREVGKNDPAGEVLRQGNAPVLLDLLAHEQDPNVLAWTVSAIGYHGIPEALPGVLRLLEHPDDSVRFYVSSCLPGFVDDEEPRDTDDAVISALEVLTGDEDEDVRDYAIYGLVTELTLPPERIAGTVARLLADPDPQVRRMAEGHRSD